MFHYVFLIRFKSSEFVVNRQNASFFEIKLNDSCQLIIYIISFWSTNRHRYELCSSKCPQHVAFLRLLQMICKYKTNFMIRKFKCAFTRVNCLPLHEILFRKEHVRITFVGNICNRGSTLPCPAPLTL